MRAWPWIACLGLLACPERSFQSIGSDASVVDDAGMDGGPADGGECLPTGWRLETRPIVEVTPLFPTPSRLGATEQLDVAVQLNNSCERLSHLEDVGYSGNATDFVGLVAHVWVPGFCLGPAVVSVAHRVFRVPEWGNYRVVVSDRSESTGELLFSWDREQCSGSPDCTCWGGGPRGDGAEGTTCRTDCSCVAGLSCLCATGVATSEPCACARPCADFLDCAAGERCATLLGFSCAAGSSCADGRCPDGFVCRDDQCMDQRTVSGAICSCDEECRVGELCAVPSGFGRRCGIPCWRDADCPTGRGLGCVANLCELLE